MEKELTFPKTRPKCCGKEMYPTGGTVGKIDEKSVRTWRCEKCNKELIDLPS